MDVSSVLAQAWEQVEKAKLPASLQEVAFREAVQLLTAGQGNPATAHAPAPASRQAAAAAGRPKKRVQQPAVKTVADGSASVQDVLPPLTEKQFYEKLESETGVSQEKLERVFHIEAGAPHISLKPAQLGDGLKGRMVAIAQVICVARAVAYGEDGTSMRVIRAECRALRSYDDKNINTYLSNLDGLVYVGPSRDKRLKVRPAGERAFPAVIDNLLGVKATADDDQS